MSKKIILATVLAGLSSAAFAGEKGPTVTLGGSIDTQAGFRKEKNNNKYTNNYAATGDKRQTSAIVNDTKLSVAVDGKAHGMSYGGKIVLNADSSKNKFGNDKIAYETKVHAESFLGRVEAGSTAGVYDAMTVSAGSVARATGGASNGDAQYWVNQTTNLDFVTSGSLYTNANSGAQQQAAKVSYYTPSYMGLKLGVSYIPDLNQKGSVNGLTSLAGHTGVKTYSSSGADANQYGALTGLNFKNVWSGGVSYNGKFNHFGIAASVLGENGSAKHITDTASASAADRSARFKKLSSVEAGLKVSYNGFAIAGSYADLGKSGLDKASLQKKSSYWTAGLGYDYHNLGASVTYMESKKGAAGFVTATGAESSNTVAAGNTFGYNKQKNLSVGIDYKLAPGFMPYVEYTNFKQTYANAKKHSVDNNKGNVVLVGTKLQF